MEFNAGNHSLKSDRQSLETETIPLKGQICEIYIELKAKQIFCIWS